MNYRLVPKPWGYYAEVGARNEPTIEVDLPYLLSADEFAMERAVGGWSLRSQVLIVSDTEPPREGV